MTDPAQQAAAANREIYASGWTEKFVEGAPHLKHAALRALFLQLLNLVCDRALIQTTSPRVLDLGAGEGSVTRLLLERGARVTAVDVSESQLAELRRKCEPYADRLDVRCGEVGATIAALEGPFDVAIASAFLHHVPDYLALLRRTITLLGPNGQFLSFQDPLRYDALSKFTRAFDDASYLSWRLFQGDLWGGFRRRIRRNRGRFDDSPLDNAEYHVVRNGVDQEAIALLFRESSFDCEVIRYFSTQSRVFQPVGTLLGVANTFAVQAVRR